MGALHILHLSDGRPGHYHLAEGVIAALGRARETAVTMQEIKRRWVVPGRLLRALLDQNRVSPNFVLKLGFGIGVDPLAPVDLVISSGGQTLPANVAAARALGAGNIFVGSLRGMAHENFSLIISSYERHAGLPRHLVTLKPSALDPDKLERPAKVPTYSPANPPELAGLLIGGNSGLFKYKEDEWRRLFDFVREVSAAWGTRWLVSTSPRTDRQTAEAAFNLAKDKKVVADFLDFNLAGPGSLEKIFARADMILCSEDSSTMISEAAWARLPVIGVSPAHHAFKPEEREYRQLLAHNNWCRFLPIAQLSVERFGTALAEIEPFSENPLDGLAGELQTRLPELFENSK